jgi:hypothetical protein
MNNKVGSLFYGLDSKRLEWEAPVLPEGQLVVPRELLLESYQYEEWDAVGLTSHSMETEETLRPDSEREWVCVIERNI